MENSDAYQSAKKRVGAKMGFYTHLSIYLTVILFLAVINLLTSSSTVWFHWLTSGWGIAVALHGLAVLVFPGRFAVTDKVIEKIWASPVHILEGGRYG